MRQMTRCDARARIGNADRQPFPVVFRGDGHGAQSGPRRQRMLGVREQIEHDLLKLERVGHRRRHRRIEAHDDIHLRVAERIAPQLERVLDDSIEIGRGALRLMLAREGQQIRDDLRRALRLVMNRLQRLAIRLAGFALVEQQLGERHDAGQRVVQLVRDPAHQLSDRGELLLLYELLRDADLFRDVADDARRLAG